ncbi:MULTISPECIES: hypothetical protein [Neisseria]|uniref:hypothetical protein n=1 Tax=Neisseria TaxID=482 RepID=UPI00272C434E|nr:MULTISPECIES: hypothetical protein [Neisseria]
MPSEKIRRHPFYWLKRLKTNQSYNSNRLLKRLPKQNNAVHRAKFIKQPDSKEFIPFPR